MTTSFAHLVSPHATHRGVIAILSEQLHVPMHEVNAIYREQLNRLAVQARIQNYVPVLALRNTRSILRTGCKPARVAD